MARILAFAGSTRQGSFNEKLIRRAVDIARDAGGEVELVDLADYEMPLYNADLEAEEGVPESAVELKRLMVEHDGLLLACPEYNSSVTPLLKNTIDWVSRRVEDEPPLIAFRGKVATLLSASPGSLGGLRGLVHVRSILGNLGVLVLPTQVAVSRARDAFDDRGALKDEKTAGKVRRAVEQLVEAVRKLAD